MSKYMELIKIHIQLYDRIICGIKSDIEMNQKFWEFVAQLP